MAAQQPGLFTIDSDEIRAAARAFQAAPVQIRTRIQSATSGTMTGAWGEELAASGGTAQQHAIIAGGASAVGTTFGITMKAATSGARLSGGLVPSVDGRAFEFGKLTPKRTTYQSHSRKGKSYSITRTTTNQLPSRSTKGWVAYPASSRTFKRVLEMWLQIIVKVSHDAAEGQS